MSWRIKCGRFLLRLASFLQTLPVVVMKPDDLIEFSRQTYFQPQNIQAWAEDTLVDSGLSSQELNLLQEIPIRSGNLLMLGIGGGREAIPLAKMGYQVTGIDFIKELATLAEQNANKRGVQVECLCQEISHLNVPEESFDIVWLSRAMYSSIPTRERRVGMLKTILAALKSGGYFLCQFHMDPSIKLSKRGYFLRKVIATITFGNKKFEPGDSLWFNVEFIHSFPSEVAVRSELKEGGFHDCLFAPESNQNFHGVVCHKE